MTVSTSFSMTPCAPGGGDQAVGPYPSYLTPDHKAPDTRIGPLVSGVSSLAPTSQRPAPTMLSLTAAGLFRSTRTGCSVTASPMLPAVSRAVTFRYTLWVGKLA